MISLQRRSIFVGLAVIGCGGCGALEGALNGFRDAWGAFPIYFVIAFVAVTVRAVFADPSARAARFLACLVCGFVAQSTAQIVGYEIFRATQASLEQTPSNFIDFLLFRADSGMSLALIGRVHASTILLRGSAFWIYFFVDLFGVGLLSSLFLLLGRKNRSFEKP